MPEKSEIIKINDREFQIGENKIILIEDNIVYVIANGDQTDRIALAHIQHTENIGKQITGKLNYLINLNNAGKNSPGARKVWQDISDMEIINKIALFGIHPVARVLASFVIGMTKRDNIVFFDKKEEAINWIKE
jgi:hypothetical protein